jgi:ABC-type Zn2+ transport system substrate-binding protein/surface adhesin
VHHDCGHLVKLTEQAEVMHQGSEKHTSVLNIKQFMALMGIIVPGDEDHSTHDHSHGHSHNHSHDHHHHEKDGDDHDHGEDDEC